MATPAPPHFTFVIELLATPLVGAGAFLTPKFWRGAWWPSVQVLLVEETEVHAFGADVPVHGFEEIGA
jgi:hypothetical protein